MKLQHLTQRRPSLKSSVNMASAIARVHFGLPGTGQFASEFLRIDRWPALPVRFSGIAPCGMKV
jgi:hypothetical protein